LECAEGLSFPWSIKVGQRETEFLAYGDVDDREE